MMRRSLFTWIKYRIFRCSVNGQGNNLFFTRKNPLIKINGFFRSMVPKARLELARAIARHPLKMVCLPIPPLRQKVRYL